MKKQTMRMRAVTFLTDRFIAHIVFGIINSILVIRALGESGIGIYVLIRPTLALATTLTGLGKHKIRPALLVAGFLILLAAPLSHYALHEPGTYLPLLFLAPLALATSFSQKLEAYLLYLDNTTPSAMMSFLYQCVRLGASLFFIQRFQPLGPSWVISGLMLAYLLAEIVSLLGTSLIYFAHKKKEALPLALQYLKRPNKTYNPEAPVQTIVAATEFLEPIIVMQLFFGLGLPSEISRNLYGAVTGFTMPILLMPLFLTQGLSKVVKSSINPKKIFPESLKLVFVVCGLYTLAVLLFPTELMRLYFQTSTGAQYLRLLAPFMFLYFFQQLFLAFLGAVGQSGRAALPVLVASVLRIVLMFLLLPHMRFNIFGLIYAMSAYLLVSTVWIFWRLKQVMAFTIDWHAILHHLLAFGTALMVGLYATEHLPPLLQLPVVAIVFLGICKLKVP